MKKNMNNSMKKSWPVLCVRYSLSLVFLAMLSAIATVHAQTPSAATLPSSVASKMDGATSTVGKSIKITAPWVRATVPGQKGTGGFMTLTSPVDMQLVGVTSAVAGVAEVHEMRMEGDVMRMRAIPSLALPAGKPVTLAPGGYHLMLLDLKAPLQAGTAVAVILQFQDAKGARFEQEVNLPVAMSSPDQPDSKGMPPSGAAHRHH